MSIKMVREALSRAMAERGWSANYTARRAGIEPNVIYRIESQETGERLAWVTVHKLIRGLGLTYSEFFRDAPGDEMIGAARLGQALASLPPDDRGLILDIVRRLVVERSAKERDLLRAIAIALEDQRDTG